MRSSRPGKRRLTNLKSREDHGDEAWLVSYADMVTLLFGFFVILYSFSTIDDKKYEKMSDEIASAFKSKEENLANDNTSVVVSEDSRKIRALRMVVSMMNLGGSMSDNITMIEKSFNNRESAESLKNLGSEMSAQAAVLPSASAANTHVDLILSENSLFHRGGYDLNEKALPHLKRLADDISSSEHVAEVSVSGHTDSVKPSSNAFYKSNFVLSSLRAGAVAEALIRYGVDPKLIRVEGVGSLQPLQPEYDRAGVAIPSNMAMNRRVQIVVRREVQP